MAFPISPANNQISLVNGIEYVYNTSKGAWYRYGDTTANVITSNTFQAIGSTAATSNSTGSVIVIGGVGVQGNVFADKIYTSGLFYAANNLPYTGIYGATGLAGTNGATGVTGSNGTNGATGSAGSNGTNGATGVSGATGSAGSNGTNGATGSAGSNGTNGATGSAGSNGTNGATGVSGATGSAGTNGATGVSGATGSAGTNGATGLAGTNGATGSAGNNGATGVTGSNGTNGATGPKGSTGSDGLQGASGATGINGATGATGPAGSNGTNGSAGNNGATGATGISGATGSAGSNGTNGATGSAGINGASGFVGSNGTNGATGATGIIGGVSNLGATGINYYPVLAGSTGPLSAGYLGGTSLSYNPSTTVFSSPFVSATGSVSGSANYGAISYGTMNYSDNNIVASFSSSANTYNEMVLQNTSNGTNASVNFNVSNDQATNSTNYGEFGMNSSTFAGGNACSFNLPGMVYLTSGTTDLAIGTYSTGSIHLVVNNSITDAMTIRANNAIYVNAPVQYGTGATGFVGATGTIGAQTAYFTSAYINGSPLVSGATGVTGTPTSFTSYVDTFTGNGSQTTFTLSVVPDVKTSTYVYLNGVYQNKSTYSLSGANVTFTGTATANDTIEVTTVAGSIMNVSSSAYSTRIYQGNGSTTTFTITAGHTANNVMVFNNGICQFPISDYTVSGTTLTYVVAPQSDETVQIREMPINTLVAVTQPNLRRYTANGVQTIFTVTSGQTANTMFVYENGVCQMPINDYTVSGTSLTFTTAPTADKVIQIREMSV